MRLLCWLLVAIAALSVKALLGGGEVSPNTRVKVVGLQKASYNGLTGKVLKSAHREGRFLIMLDNDMKLSVEGKNLEVIEERSQVTNNPRDEARKLEKFGAKRSLPHNPSIGNDHDLVKSEMDRLREVDASEEHRQPVAVKPVPVENSSASKEILVNELERLRNEGQHLRAQHELLDLRSRHKALQKQLEQRQHVESNVLQPGARVTLKDLKATEYNGKRAIVLSNDVAKGRVIVAVENSDENFSVKPENIETSHAKTESKQPEIISNGSGVSEYVPVDVTPTQQSPTVLERLAPGKQVILEGLESKNYNGKKAKVIGMKAGTDRIEVELEENKKHIAVKSTNLKTDLSIARLKSELNSDTPWKDLTDDELRDALKLMVENRKTSILQSSLLARFPVSSHVVFSRFEPRPDLPDLTKREGIVVGMDEESQTLTVRIDGKGPDVEAHPTELQLFDEFQRRVVHNSSPIEEVPTTQNSEPEQEQSAIPLTHGKPHKPVISSPFVSGLLHKTVGQMFDTKATEEDPAKREHHAKFMEKKATPGTKVVLRSTREVGIINDRQGKYFQVRLPGNTVRTVTADDIEMYNRLLAYLNDE